MRETIELLWANVERGSPPWAATLTVLAALALTRLLRRFVDADAQIRARIPTVFLLAALVFRASAWVVARAGVGTPVSVLGLLAVLSFVVGIVALAGLIAFDLVFRRFPVPAVLRELAQLLVVMAIFVGILYQHGLDPWSMVATGSVVTAVIGLALQSTIANVFAGLAIPLEGEFAIGDWIEVGAHTGRIREIKWRSTTIVTKDGDTVIVPNNQLITTTVKNFSRPTAVHRVSIRLAFDSRHPPNEVRAVVLDAVQATPGILADPAPGCTAVDFGDEAVVYGVRFWIDDFLRTDRIAGEVRARLWYAARRAGLDMPTTTTTLVTPAPAAEDAPEARRRALARVDLFTPLDEDSRNRLAGGLREQHFAAGEDIIRQDAPGDSLFIIDRGKVDVRVSVDGVHSSLAQLGPGQFFGEMSLMTGEPRRATSTALTATLCYVIDQAAFRCVLDSRPALAEDISRMLAQRQTELTAEREGLSAEALIRRERETRSRLLNAIRRAFSM